MYFLHLVYFPVLKVNTYKYLVESDYASTFAVCQRAIEVTPICLSDVEVSQEPWIRNATEIKIVLNFSAVIELCNYC